MMTNFEKTIAENRNTYSIMVGRLKNGIALDKSIIVVQGSFADALSSTVMVNAFSLMPPGTDSNVTIPKLLLSLLSSASENEDVFEFKENSNVTDVSEQFKADFSSLLA